MVINESTQENATILQMSGSLDVRTGGLYKQAIEKSKDSGKKCLILDFQDVSFIDSSALGFLHLSAKELTTNDMVLRIASPSDSVKKILELVNMQKTIPVFPNINDALIA